MLQWRETFIVPSLALADQNMDSLTLVAQLQQLGLWPEEESVRNDLLRLQQSKPEARALAKELLARNLLTAYQLNQILAGKGQSLIAGPYRIEERLGEGGNAQVFKARHYRHRRVVALKVIRPERLRDNPVAVQRFIREASAAATLSHPNVVRAYDVGDEGEVYYFAMQFLEGVDLARLVKKQGPLELPRACDYVLQAARGLQHIHEHNLVHRDIKPSNLMVSVRADPSAGPLISDPELRTSLFGTIKVLDLGLARLDEDPNVPDQQTALTLLGTVMGTPDYMAPEQALHSRNADIRSDIYSLGCTFFFMLTGQPPFPGGDAIQKMLKHQLEEPPAIQLLRPGVPAAVIAILKRMLAKAREDRFQTPAELVDALEAFLAAPTQPFSADVPLRSAASNPLPPSNEAPVDLTLTLDETPDPVAQAAARQPVAIPVARTAEPAPPAAQPVGESELLPLIPSPLVRVPSRGSDWGLWVFLACACIGAIVCLIVAVKLVVH